MQTLLTLVSLVVLIFAACVVALNWAYVIANIHFYRQGIGRRISLVHLVPQLLVVVAAILSSRVAPPFLPTWLLWLIALADAGLLQILIHPAVSLLRKLRAQT